MSLPPPKYMMQSIFAWSLILKIPIGSEIMNYANLIAYFEKLAPSLREHYLFMKG